MFALGLAGALAVACVDVVSTRAAFSPASPGGPDRTILVGADVGVLGQGGVGHRIPGGSRWMLVGTVEEGDVYRRTDGPFVIHGANAHEAYLVVTNNRVVGFYLPGEGTFAPAAQPEALPPQR
jgi:hypothetical protein